MEIVQPARLDLVGEVFRMYVGSYWLQPLIYFQPLTPESQIGQVTEVVSDTSTSSSGDATGPTYEVQLVNGGFVKPIVSLSATVWMPGDWVIVSKKYGEYKISADGAPELEDFEDLIRVVMQVRDRPNGRILLTLDSENSGDATKPSVKISPDAATSLELYCPPQFKISPSMYEYDLFFYYSAVDPYEPVMRQYGRFEISPSITRRD